jgi:hypothetical protein
VTRHHIAEERIFQPTRRENFKTRTYVLDRKREEKRSFGRPGSEGEDGMETDVTGTEFEALGKIYVTQVKNQSLF